ncbi:MAG: phage head closure protein [Prevotellaceae bacterium]|nr:phage head closure protein [Prevotellaceae bacterium]
MTYSSGMLNQRVKFYHPAKRQGVKGEATAYTFGQTCWAAVDFARGTRALRQGQVEVYTTIMLRLRFAGNSGLTEYDRIEYLRKYYAIESFNADPAANTIQITAVQVAPFKITVNTYDDGAGY